MPELYWTLVIEDNLVQASIWTITDGEEKKVKIISTSGSTNWESDEDLIVAADTSLSECVQSFPENEAEPTKTVFGVPASWVSEGNIKSEYLEKIKILCSKLSLQPAGFVVLSEAVAYWVKSVEGSPLTGIVIGLDRQAIDISLFKLGNLVGTVSVARSMSLIEDVIEGLARFPQEDNFPSRFLLFDGKSAELELAQDTLLQADWLGSISQRVKFLHTPKVEILDVAHKVSAVSLAGASEIAGVTHLLDQQPIVDEPEKHTLTNFVTEEVANVESQTVDPRELGFALGEDVQVANEPMQVNDYAHTQASNPEKPDYQNTNPSLAFINSETDQINHQLKGITHKIKRLFHQIKAKILAVVPQNQTPKINFEKLSGGALPFKFGLIGLIVVIVGLFAAWWFLPKANVVVYVSPKKLTKKEAIVIDTTRSSSNLEERILSGKTATKEVSGEASGQTSGTKTVGERAKGKIQIRNGTSSAVKLTTSSVITSSSGLKFNPDASASISAATSPASPGTAIIDVTASDIGSDYNFAKGESFKVGNYPKSEVDAVAETNFSGGSSREIQAVSASDRDKLEEKLSDELKAKAQDELTVSANEVLIGDATSIAITEANFNHKVGDEAQEIKLTMSAEASAPATKKEELIGLARKLLENDIPQGFSLRDDQIVMEFELEDADDGVYELQLTATANLLPQTDTTDIAKKIKGKYPSRAQEYLATVPGYSRVEIKLTPSLPGKLGSLPRLAKNITVEVAAEK